jgi:hypothetical protein
MQVCPLRPGAAERDKRQAMPRAEPALNLARLPLSAVVGAAITTRITKTTLCLTSRITRAAQRSA